MLYNLRRLLIAEKILELQTELVTDDAVPNDLEASQESLEAIRDYTSLKQLLFEKLNRVL